MKRTREEDLAFLEHYNKIKKLNPELSDEKILDKMQENGDSSSSSSQSSSQTESKKGTIEEYKDVLNEQQFEILKQCFESRPSQNVFITGQAGTGKTYLIKMIKKYAKVIHKRLFVTASTGVAAVNISGTTFHYFAGIGLGEETVGECHRKLSKDTKSRILDTDILIIDEVSMLDPDFVAKCDAIFKIVRNSSAVFGGMQLIFVGDFLQLPPVSKSKDESKKRYLFNEPVWKQANFQYYSLKLNYRQNADNRYASILSDMRTNELMKKTFEDLKEKARKPIPPEKGAIPQLFCKKIEVADFNQQELDKLTGESHTFKAHGENMEKISNSVPVDYIMTLKVGASVLLCRNIDMSRKLFNGKRGVIESFKKEGDNHIYPVVKFTDGQSVMIKEATWSLEDNKGNIISTFYQIPLILAYAITTHKTQGMTLEEAVIHGGFFENGHAYVAFSRIKTIDGLYIKNDIPYNQIKTDTTILEFYRKHNLL